MENNHRMANLKAILKATLAEVRSYREKARDARGKLLLAMQEVARDPAHAHLRYSEVGRLYIEQERFNTLSYLSFGSSLTLRREIQMLKAQLS
jgi:hypothetical protein